MSGKIAGGGVFNLFLPSVRDFALTGEQKGLNPVVA